MVLIYFIVMSKLKAPLLSLGASGTISKSTTFQRNKSGNIVREKPELPYRRTLLQQYQRWLYEDYIQYWHEQSAATKQQWESDARRLHLSGFAYWMKYHLSNLPDIAGLWRMDSQENTLVRDFSGNGHDGVPASLTVVPGTIGNALEFDSSSSKIVIPHDDLLSPTPISLFVIYTPSGFPNSYNSIASYESATAGWTLLVKSNGKLAVYLGDGVAWTFYDGSGVHTLNVGTTYRLCFTFDGDDLVGYVNGVFDASHSRSCTIALPTVQDMHYGNWYVSGRDIRGILDHSVLYNRALSFATVQAQSVRSYP